MNFLFEVIFEIIGSAIGEAIFWVFCLPFRGIRWAYRRLTGSSESPVIASEEGAEP